MLKEIKVSPFSLVEGEKLEFIAENPNARNLYLYDIQEKILIFVNQHLFLSSKMIIEHFQEFTALELKRHIKFLLKNSYLRAAFFKTDTGRSSGRGYFLGWRGKRQMNILGIKPNRYNELACLTATDVKAIMSANQLILKAGIENECVVRKPIFTTSAIFSKKCFRISGYVPSDNTEYLFYSIRSHSAEEITEKANRMYSTLKRKNNINSHKRKVIVCICDSREHMDEVKKIVSDSRLYSLKNTEIYFENDIDINFGNDLKFKFLHTA